MLQRVMLRAVASRRTSRQAVRRPLVRFVARSFAAEAVVAKAPQKVTTGLTGLDVQPEGRAILSKLYEKILSELQQMPADAPYRVHLTRVMNHRLDILRKTENVLEIEAKIEDGQVEEMIEEAEEELEVLALMAKEQPWKADKWHTIPVLWSDLKD